MCQRERARGTAELPCPAERSMLGALYGPGVAMGQARDSMLMGEQGLLSHVRLLSPFPAGHLSLEGPWG